jgi:hypothetical protein
MYRLKILSNQSLNNSLRLSPAMPLLRRTWGVIAVTHYWGRY